MSNLIVLILLGLVLAGWIIYRIITPPQLPQLVMSEEVIHSIFTSAYKALQNIGNSLHIKIPQDITEIVEIPYPLYNKSNGIPYLVISAQRAESSPLSDKRLKQFCEILTKEINKVIAYRYKNINAVTVVWMEDHGRELIFHVTLTAFLQRV